MKKYRYSEIFKSIQGEGHYTGVPTSWLRTWGCNFSCRGFSQESRDPDTWVDEWAKIDLTDITELTELPVISKGCDTQYTWDKRFIHLAHTETAKEIVDHITTLSKSDRNPDGKFLHPNGFEQHMAFTGGEPIIAQHAMVAVMNEFKNQNNSPAFVTVETNGTRLLKPDTVEMIGLHGTTDEYGGLVEDSRGQTEWFWSVSPKLSVSGEKWASAIKPTVLQQYASVSNHGQLKFVVDGTEAGWDEVERAVTEYRDAGITWPVWIMPCGATMEQQIDIQKTIAIQCIERGYNFSMRIHTIVFGNKVGT